MSIDLLGGWRAAVETVQSLKDNTPPEIPLPVNILVAASQIHFVSTEEEAKRMLGELKSASIRAIALDTEFQYSRAPIRLKSKDEWMDCRSLVPLALSVAAWVDKPGEPSSQAIVQYVLDLRVAHLIPYVDALLRLRVPFIFHYLKAEMMTFWALGLVPHLKNIYDTFVAASCIHMGVHHPRAQLMSERPPKDDIEMAKKEKSVKEKRAGLLSLVGQCRYYKLAYSFSEERKNEFRKQFLELQPGSSFTQGMVEYAAADAEWTLRLYIAQQQDVLRNGLQKQLYEVEFPFAIANARMEWNGVLLSSEKMTSIREGCASAVEHFGDKLRTLGMENPGSRPQFVALMRRLGLLRLFTKRTRGGAFSTKDEILEPIEDAHPAIAYFRKYNKYRDLLSEEWISGIFVGNDGRTHPNHRQLGAQTGRNSCTDPNIVGVGKIFRPVVIAPLGRAILEADYSQVEVGVAGAEYNDPQLIAAYNSGDVYAYMAQRFYQDKLSTEEKTMPVLAFKKKHGDLRNNMKTFVLAVLFNITAESIAARFGIPLKEAKKQREQFLNLFPGVKRALEESSFYGHYRGYAYTCLGLRRHIPSGSKFTQWTKNFLRNTPIQGSAATVFKKAVVHLDEAFLGTENKIILTAHDAVVVECPENEIESTAQVMEFVMRTTLRSFYPQLAGKVDVNKEHPHCWNKDGHVDSIDCFLRDPMHKLK